MGEDGMRVVHPTLDELLPTAEARARFEEKAAALEAADLVRKMRLQAFTSSGTRGISQRELARRANMRQPQISQIESGEGRDGPTYAVLRRLAYACGLDWGRILRHLLTTVPSQTEQFTTAKQLEAKGAPASDTQSEISFPEATPVLVTEPPKPAVPVKNSVHVDYIICLEDGKKLKMLKRHLKTAYNMSPETYRERWGLEADYPMVAPSYARQRSRLAKEIGLGGRPRRARG
jgi:predicted transcriptional regulator